MSASISIVIFDGR